MYVVFATIIILLLVFIFEFNKKENNKTIKNLQFAASLPGVPILLSIVDSLQIACSYKELPSYLITFTKKYGSPSRFILGSDVFVILAKPEDYKLVLANVNGNYKSSVTKYWYPLFGNGIIRISGTAHRIRRKIIQPYLNIKYLSDYVTCFDNCSNYCANLLEKEIGGHIFDIKPYVARFVTDIFLASIAGIQAPASKDEYDDLVYWQESIMQNVFKKGIKPWLQLDWIFSLSNTAKLTYYGEKFFQDFVYNIKSQKSMKIDALDNDVEILQKSFVSNYINHVQQLSNDTSKSSAVSDEDLTDDIRNLYIAGQNTIMELICFTLLMLGMHTEIQEKLRKEILLTFGNDKVDAKRLTSMRYLYMVIQETLRLFPLAPFISRQLTGDIKLESCTLPDGCLVMIPIIAVHRNPTYWEKPEEFIPERFSPENSSSRHRYAFIPFGTGPKDCLGQRYAFLSAGTIIVNLLRKYRLVAPGSIKDIKLRTDIVLRSQDGIKLSILRA